jgi:putative ATPase
VAEAREAVRTDASADVPEHLRDASYGGAERLGHGAGYRMPRSEAEGRGQEYAAERRTFYRPGEAGYEKAVRERLSRWDCRPPVEDPEGRG